MIARRLAIALATALAASSAARAQTAPPRRAPAAATAAKKPAAKKAPVAPATPPAPATPEKAPAAATAPAIAATPAAPEPPRPTFSPLPAGRTLAGEAWRGTLLVGPEIYDGATALKLRADLETDLLPLAPRAMLSGVVCLGFARWSEDETTPLLDAQVTSEASTNTFELVPSLRTSVGVGRKGTLHADAGLGLFHARTSVETSAPGLGSVKGSSSTTGAVLRFGVGGQLDVNPRLRLAAEAIGLNFHLADGGATSVTILGGAAYRF
ncbi:hypothetical protein Anae109_3450 [Anaeromyxobacter sp. Fw109-5]|nr:hypothetical protein Anae109_3450 [Anaeromyxobacter sp. Fw109-5]